MRKLALINLIVLIAIKSVSACTAVVGAPHPVAENEREIFTYLSISLGLTLGTILLLYLKKTGESFIPAGLSLIIFIFAYLGSATNGGDCGDNAAWIANMAFVITLVCFLAQFTTWFLFRN